MSDERPRQVPPKHVVVLCHPAGDSFNAAVAERYCETVRRLGHDAILRDLYRLGFDPVLREAERPSEAYHASPDVEKELAILDGAAAIVLVYPIWFAMPPAMLKGYVDRVLGAGFSFRAVRDRLPGASLAGKRLVSITSSGTGKPWLEEQGAWVSLRKLFDDYLCRAFSMQRAVHLHFDSIVDGLKERFVAENLYRVEQLAREICSEIAADLASVEDGPGSGRRHEPRAT